jgi:hypothetical protein
MPEIGNPADRSCGGARHGLVVLIERPRQPQGVTSGFAGLNDCREISLATPGGTRLVPCSFALDEREDDGHCLFRLFLHDPVAAILNHCDAYIRGREANFGR